MLSNTFLSKVSSFFSSLFRNRETNEKIYDPSSDDFILVNGKQISVKNHNSDINIIFPEFSVEKQCAENLSQQNNFHFSNLKYEQTEKEERKNKENYFNLPTSINLINNKIFPIFYIVFALSFLIFLFIYEKSSIKIKDNYVQIANTNFFVFDFFKLQNISHFIFHIFTFYTAIFGLCIVYIAFTSVFAKNSVLPAKAKFTKYYFYGLFAFGFFSNLLKLLSGLIIYTKFPGFKVDNQLKHKSKLSASLQEIIFNAEVYFTIAYGVMLFHFLKYFGDFHAKINDDDNNNNNEIQSVSYLDKESSLNFTNKDNINNISSEDYYSKYNIENNINTDTKINLDNKNNFSLKENEANKSLIDKTNKIDTKQRLKNNSLIDPKWLKFKFFSLLYLFLMLLSLHLLKLSANYFMSKTEFERNKYGMLKKHPVDSAYINHQYLVAFLPYGIYFANSMFYFLNYGLLRNSQVKLFIDNNEGNK